ncbi:MAG: hypothetical protein Q9198_010486, partial [Flavoplaca austrocitrina]
HCRLSINDLSPSGSQPLTSDDGQIHAVVNGEIYDYDRLRDICATEHGYKFNGESDSQLVVALYKIHGAPAFFEHLRGEFAFVLYDGREGRERVIAGRDRFGIKPLVWTVVDGRLLMAAEAKAFLPMGWKPEWDVGAIVDGGWMMDERTLFKGVKKVLPGHCMEVTEERGVETRKYWDAEYEDKSKVETRSIDEMVLGVRERLVESIRLRLRADVPVGVYLSGGIDSSAVAGIVTQLAKENNVKIGSQAPSTRVACFSVRFPEESGYDESSRCSKCTDTRSFCANGTTRQVLQRAQRNGWVLRSRKGMSMKPPSHVTSPTRPTTASIITSTSTALPNSPCQHCPGSMGSRWF